MAKNHISTRRQLWRIFRTTPRKAQLLVATVTLVVVWLPVNWAIQAVRKPAELFFPVSPILYKGPRATWAAYHSLFRSNSTAAVTPDLLAALAQVEAGGNPIARTYWRWSLTTKPFEIYKPASSAVGLYQITDGTFEVARRLCIHDHAVVEDDRWYSWRSCWFNSLYSRVVPSHAIEMTAAHLDRQVSTILSSEHLANVSLRQKQNLAIVIHLCGSGAGKEYARRRMRLSPHQRCGDQGVSEYLAHVRELQAVFGHLQTYRE